MTFGQRLRDSRQKAGMSQAELTRLSGVPKTMLSRYENDHILPSISTLQKLSTALGIGDAALLGDGDGEAGGTFEGALGRRGITMKGDDATTLANMVADMVDERDSRVGFLEAPNVRPA